MKNGENIVPQLAFIALLLVFLCYGEAPDPGNGGPARLDAVKPVASRTNGRNHLISHGKQAAHREQLSSVTSTTFHFNSYDLTMNGIVGSGDRKIMTGSPSRNQDSRKTSLNINQKISHPAK